MISIDVWSDINCPFCYIGKRHLEMALKQFEGETEVTWKSFELDPAGHPPKDADNTELLAKKYGRDRKWAEEMNRSMTSMAKAAGLDFHMTKIIPANSFKAHRLLHLAKDEGCQDQLKEKLLAAKFIEGKDIEDDEVLLNSALELGLQPPDVEEVLKSQKYSEQVRADEQEAAQHGISGVPFFVINRQYALSGAQPVESFLEVLKEVAGK